MLNREVKTHEEVTAALKTLIPELPNVTSVNIETKAVGVCFSWESPDEEEKAEKPAESNPIESPPKSDDKKSDEVKNQADKSGSKSKKKK